MQRTSPDLWFQQCTVAAYRYFVFVHVLRPRLLIQPRPHNALVFRVKASTGTETLRQLRIRPAPQGVRTSDTKVEYKYFMIEVRPFAPYPHSKARPTLGPSHVQLAWWRMDNSVSPVRVAFRLSSMALHQISRGVLQ